jgi:sorbitol-specific phosphotransferase system component IIBC
LKTRVEFKKGSKKEEVKTRKQENKKTRKQENKKTRKQENKKTRKQKIQEKNIVRFVSREAILGVGRCVGRFKTFFFQKFEEV